LELAANDPTSRVQGRNKPDAATLNLVMAFDKSPELIEQAVLEPVR
jgi:hypothetical protein